MGVLGGEMLQDPAAKGLCKPWKLIPVVLPQPQHYTQQLHQQCQIRASAPRMVQQLPGLGERFPPGSPHIPTLTHCAEGKGSLCSPCSTFLGVLLKAEGCDGVRILW